MKELRQLRRKDNCYTVVLCSPDYGSFPAEGCFDDEYSYFQFDSEQEMLGWYNDPEDGECVASDTETVYFGKEDVTDKYLEFEDGYGYKLKAQYKAKENNND